MRAGQNRFSGSSPSVQYCCFCFRCGTNVARHLARETKVPRRKRAWLRRVHPDIGQIETGLDEVLDRPHQFVRAIEQVGAVLGDKRDEWAIARRYPSASD